MADIHQRLAALGLAMAPPKPSVGNYLGAKRWGDLLFASGRVSELRGLVGADVDMDAARAAARDTVLLILAIVQQETGDLDSLAGVLKMQGFIRCVPEFEALPAVLDGASDLLIHLFGEAGRHARTATGVSSLPFGAAIQLDIIFQCHRQ